MLQKYIFETKLEKTLSEKDKSICDGEITVTECSDAVNEMKLNKSPGLDGLSVEFYRTFPTVPVPLLVLPLLFPDRFFLILFLKD
jgi:hypothetical protein